jgi:hypothetical protein
MESEIEQLVRIVEKRLEQLTRCQRMKYFGCPVKPPGANFKEQSEPRQFMARCTLDFIRFRVDEGWRIEKEMQKRWGSSHPRIGRPGEGSCFTKTYIPVDMHRHYRLFLSNRH